MKRVIAVILLVIGLLSVAAGVVVPAVVNSNENTKQANSMLYPLLGKEVSPELARELLSSGIHAKVPFVGSIDITLDSFLRDGVTVMGQTITLETLLKTKLNDFQVMLCRIGVYVYAYSTYLLIGGGVLLVLGIVFVIADGKSNRRRGARY